MARQAAAGGAPAGKGITLWVGADSHDLLFTLARAEERPVQTVLRRAIMAYAEESQDFQRWLRKHGKATKAAA